MRAFCRFCAIALVLVFVSHAACAQGFFTSDRLDQRDPSVKDDAGAGYAVGDVWINHKDHKAWKISDATKGAAKWIALSWPTVKVADVVTSAPCALAVGTRQLKSAYTGSLVMMKREKDNAANSFGFTNDGINASAIDGFLKDQPGIVTKLYDQCGDHNLTALTDHNNAGYAFDKTTGQAAIVFDGLNHTTDQLNAPLLQNAGGPKLGANNMSVFIVGATMGAATDSVLLDFDTASHGLLMGSVAGTRTFLKPAPSGGGNFGVAFESVPGVMGFTSGKEVKTYFNTRMQKVAGTYSPTVLNGLSLGGTEAMKNFPSTMDFMALMVFAGEVSPADTENLMLAADAQFGLVPQARTKLIGIGDSIMAGWGARKNWITLVQKKLPGTTGFYNFAVPGIRSSDWLKNISHITSVFVPGERYVVVIDLGGNDMKNAEARPSDAVYADVSAIMKNLRDAAVKAGATIKVGVATILPNTGTTLAHDENRKAYNALVVANKAAFDFVIDFAAHPKLGISAANNDAALYMDTIHPTSAGQELMAAQALPIIEKQ